MSTENGVTVTAKPESLARDAKSWNFEIVLDTDSQDLGDDLVKSAVLVDGGGREYKPTAATGRRLAATIAKAYCGSTPSRRWTRSRAADPARGRGAPARVPLGAEMSQRETAWAPCPLCDRSEDSQGACARALPPSRKHDATAAESEPLID